MAEQKLTKAGKPFASTTGGPGKRIVDQTNWRKKLQSNRIKFDDVAKRIFLDFFEETNQMMAAARAAGVTLVTVKNHLENDPEFLQLYEEAKEAYRDKVINHVQTLAFNGVKNPIFAGKDGEYRGDRVDYPIQLIAMEAKKVDPGYKERQEIEHRAGGGVLVAPAGMTADKWIEDQKEKNKAREAIEHAKS